MLNSKCTKRLRVLYMDEHTEAWLTCVKELERFDSSFLNREGMNGLECAASVIRELVSRAQRAAAPQAVQPAVPQLKANCYSDDNGDYWRDCPDDCEFVEGLKVGDTYELQASIRSWSETFRVTKAPDETSDDYEVELVSSDAPAHPAEGVPAQAVYAEARECSHCNHVGINDSADDIATCNECQWSGDSPKEDKCPACQAEGTMTASCPKCHHGYRLLADATLAATQPAAQGMDAQRWGVVANHWKKATFKYDRKGDLQSFVVSIDLSKQGLGAQTIASTFDEALTVLAAQAKQGGA